MKFNRSNGPSMISAVRVSTIWVTYLIFGLYLVIAVGNVTSRQLFVAELIKLPVLNVELPVVGFFFLAPILFVVLHAYVLLQLVLLAHTAAAYNDAVGYHCKIKADQERLRQRLANTLFAQMFAGSARQREGLLGILLNAVAWLVLVFFPVALLVVFELKFLPFHSYPLTWSHRIFIMIDLIMLLLLWRAALNPQRDVNWRNLTELRIGASTAIAVVVLSTVVFTFPGEFSSGWSRFHATAKKNLSGSALDAHPTYCDSQSVLSSLWSSNFDRFSFEGVQFVDHDRLKKIESNNQGHSAYASERTLDLSGRDLSCGDFQDVDLRRADLSNAMLIGSHFEYANLEGASLDHGNLQARFLFMPASRN